MVVRDTDTGKCCIVNPCYDPLYWNKPKEERVAIKKALADKTLRIENDKDGWISVWYNNRFISGWLTCDKSRLSSEILQVVARMLRAQEVQII